MFEIYTLLNFTLSGVVFIIRIFFVVDKSFDMSAERVFG